MKFLQQIRFIAAIGITLLSAAPVWAKSAEMMLVPTRIVLEKGAHYATVTVKNSGDATGRYRIDLIDATMQQDGGVKLLEDGTKDPFSALDILSISPRSMTLKPDEYQTVRILVRNPEALADGEYRSHLRVKMTETDVEPETANANPEATTIQLKPKLVMVIPVIFRHGNTSYQVSIDEAKIAPGVGDNAQPLLNLTFGFTGNQSVIGDIKVTETGDDGKENTLKFFPGVAIYRGTAKRDLSVPLEVPPGVNIHKGKIEVSYLTQDKDGGQVIAQKEVVQ